MVIWQFYIHFNNISVISGLWRGEYNELCALEVCLGFRKQVQNDKELTLLSYKDASICWVEQKL